VSRSRERDATSAAEVDADLTETRSGARRSHERDERRLTRSHSRSSTPPRRRRSRSPSNGGRERKRRRSMQRYEPANKRRRNTSSVSSPIETRNKKADTEDDSDRGSPRQEIEENKRAEESNEVGSS
jgi:serine/arginine repetitive matrix protein 1